MCCGRNCGPKGSRQLVDFLEDEVERLSLEDRVVVYPGGCQNHCDSGPTMVIYPGPVFYQEVDRQRIRRIALEHLANDKPVAEYFWVDTGQIRPDFRPTRIIPAPVQGPSQQTPRKEQPPTKSTRKKTYEVDDFKW